MTERELQRLWDPDAPDEGAGAVVALERRMRSLRAPAGLPPLELPERSAGGAVVVEMSSARRFESWALAASVLLVAAALLALFVSEPSRPESPGALPLARAPQASPSPKERPAPGDAGTWRVQSVAGEQMCNSPGVQEAVEAGSSLPEVVPLDTGPGTTARLVRGEAVVELHPNSRVVQFDAALELDYGRMWAELSPRPPGAAWELRTHGARLRTQGARFVWWAFETAANEVGVPYRVGDEVGLEVVSGRVVFVVGDEERVAQAGQRCWAKLGEQGGNPGTVIECAPVTPGSNPD